MFETLPQDLVGAIAYVLPGFVSAWIFYGLTSHLKPSQFERLVQALIFTFIIRVIVSVVGLAAINIGSSVGSFGAWGHVSEQVTSLLVAVVLGVMFAYCVNTDAFHGWLRKYNLTTRTSHPSEWFYVFSDKVKFVVLHLHDGRRLFGWPKEWPIKSDEGQFYIMLPAWIEEDNSQVDMAELDGILISATDVRWVEFIRDEGERNDEST